MLNSILIENFKSYKSQRLPLAPLTLMIGANASGKTNAIEAFRFLSWLSQGQKLSVLKHAVGDNDEVLRGKIQELSYLKGNSFSLECQTDGTEWNTYHIKICIRENKLSTEVVEYELHIEEESITGRLSTVPLYNIKQPAQGRSSDVQVAYNNFAKGGIKPTVTCTDQITILNQLVTPSMFNGKYSPKIIPETVKYFQNLMGSVFFLDLVPSLMRCESYPETQLRNTGANLAGVLYTLWQQDEQQAHILAFIQSLPEQDIKALKFYTDHRGRVELALIETFGNHEQEQHIELLSDGTLRVLAIAAALLSAPEGSTIVIEEVDNGVHPSRAKQLLTTMREHAKRRGLRLLLSTHNPALMDALPDEALGDVVFCYRDPKEGDSRLVRLSDLDDYMGLVMQGSLGQLVTRGVVDRFVKNPVTPEQQKQNALEWLAKLRGEV